MKAKLKLIVLYILSLLTLTEYCVAGDLTIELTQPPPFKLSVGTLWKMTIQNLTNSTLNIYVAGIFDKDSTRIVSGRSSNITLPPGRWNYDYRLFESGSITWLDSSMQDFILRTGNVPAGNYKTCVTVYYADSNNIIVDEDCLIQQIVRPPELEISLIFPDDGDSINADNALFIWDGAVLFPGEFYSLKIVEVIGNQSPAVAMEFDTAYFEQNNIHSTRFRYPEISRRFSGGRRYAWRIELNRDTTVLSNSDISTFSGMDIPLPVELSSFTSSVNSGNLLLNWTTASETNNSGFDIERREAKSETQVVWNKISFINGHGTTTSPNNYEFTDRNLASGKYNYRLKQIDFNGNYEYYNLSDEVVIGVPDKFSLEQNYPNPFNPNTVIRYSLSENSFVSLKVYDVTGNEVATLVNEKQNSGTYNYQFSTVNYQLSSGVYFYKIKAGNFTAVKRMILMK